MRHLFHAASLGIVIAATGASAAEVPGHIGRHVTTTDDTREIERVVEDFKTGIKTRDTRLLASLLATVPVEEKFYNVKITQDGHVAWIMFDYEFLKDNKVSNYGIETWQMMKSAEGKWKIASVWWTYNPAP